MTALQRRAQIAEKLQKDKSVVVSELSARYKVSEETIRRDLELFEKEGMCTRQYGGAVLKENVNTDMPFQIRRKENLWGKRVMGTILSDLVEDGDHIIVDPSSTAVAILNALKDKQRLTVITNSIEVLVSLPNVNTWEVISTGGSLREDYMALVGPRATSAIESINADIAILSCKGIDMFKGITDANEQFSQVKQAMLASARKKILAVDHTKFDVVAFSNICKLTDIDLLVTDIRPSDAWCTYLKDRGIPFLYGAEALQAEA